jgi:pantetheine-phosphate adenylyltransferase
MENKKRIALYPGSFDPITLGHTDLIHRMSGHYDELIVLVADNTSKNSLFSSQERKTLIEQSLEGVRNVRVEFFNGLTVNYAKSVGASTIIRGLRAISDFEYEYAMANMNRRLNPEIETLIVFTSPQYSYISSRMVKEVAQYGGSLNELVTPVVADALKNKFRN